MMGFYTYLWLREDGAPYYVGKGTWRRAHRKGGPTEDRIIMQEWPHEADAFAGEVFLIAYYGRKDNGTGILRNLTDGGEGFSGLLKSEAHKKKIGDAHRGKTLSPEHRRLLSALRKDKPLSEEHRQKLRAARLGKPKPLSEPARLRLIEANKTRVFTSSALHAMSLSSKGRVPSEAARHKMSIALLGNKNAAALKGKPWSAARRLAQRH